MPSHTQNRPESSYFLFLLSSPNFSLSQAITEADTAITAVVATARIILFTITFTTFIVLASMSGVAEICTPSANNEEQVWAKFHFARHMFHFARQKFYCARQWAKIAQLTKGTITPP